MMATKFHLAAARRTIDSDHADNRDYLLPADWTPSIDLLARAIEAHRRTGDRLRDAADAAWCDVASDEAARRAAMTDDGRVAEGVAHVCDYLEVICRRLRARGFTRHASHAWTGYSAYFDLADRTGGQLRVSDHPSNGRGDVPAAQITCWDAQTGRLRATLDTSSTMAEVDIAIAAAVAAYLAETEVDDPCA